eukprot:4550765-Pyramimonas_sp.AAC.1
MIQTPGGARRVAQSHNLHSAGKLRRIWLGEVGHHLLRRAVSQAHTQQLHREVRVGQGLSWGPQ